MEFRSLPTYNLLPLTTKRLLRQTTSFSHPFWSLTFYCFVIGLLAGHCPRVTEAYREIAENYGEHCARLATDEDSGCDGFRQCCSRRASYGHREKYNCIESETKKIMVYACLAFVMRRSAVPVRLSKACTPATDYSRQCVRYARDCFTFNACCRRTAGATAHRYCSEVATDTVDDFLCCANQTDPGSDLRSLQQQQQQKDDPLRLKAAFSNNNNKNKNQMGDRYVTNDSRRGGMVDFFVVDSSKKEKSGAVLLVLVLWAMILGKINL